MAGAALTVEFDDEDLRRVFRALERFGGNLKPLMRQWGEAMINQHEEHWADEDDPDGNPWAQLSLDYEEYKLEKRPNAGILEFDEHLRRLHYNASEDGLEFGTGRIYGATHQFGDPGRNIPARPFLGVSDDDGEELLDIAYDYFAKAVKG